MAIPQDQLAQAFADWSAANPNATDADMARAMQLAGVTPRELSLALGIDPDQGINRYNLAVQQNPLSNPLTYNESSTGNPLLNASIASLGDSVYKFLDNQLTAEATTAAVNSATTAAQSLAAGGVGGVEATMDAATGLDAMGQRLPGSLASGIFNFATADNASERKAAALNTLVSVIGGPPAVLFKAFLDQFGFFKGGSRAVNLTPEQQVEEA